MNRLSDGLDDGKQGLGETPEWWPALERRIRAVDLVLDTGDDDWSEADEAWSRAMVERIVALPQHAEPQRARWAMVGIPLGAAAAATLALVIALSGAVPTGVTPSAAAAVMPLPLELSAAQESTTEALALVEQALAESEGPAEALRESVSIGWYLKIDGDTMRIEPGPIVPQVVHTWWNEDLSGRIVMSTGDPYYPGRPDEPVQPEEAPPPGTVLHDMVFAPGEFDTAPVVVVGDSIEAMRTVLEANGMEEDASAARTIDVISGVFSHWTLTNAQQRTVLRILAQTDGLEIAGTTRDRAGRDVIVFRAVTRDGSFEQLLLVSAETGRMVGQETTRLRPYGGIPAGTLMSYQLWEVDIDL